MFFDSACYNVDIKSSQKHRGGVIKIKCLFWNINKKDLAEEVMECAVENNVDIIITAESETLNVDHMLSELHKRKSRFERKEVLPVKEDIKLFAKETLEVTVYKEDKHVSLFKVHEKKRNYLLVAVHFSSAMYKSEESRGRRADDLARFIEKQEEDCNKGRGISEGEYQTIVVGDFNLHPFSSGIIGCHGFQAVYDVRAAKKGSRIVENEERRFYYNPMWDILGKHSGIMGTYYCESDQDDRSFYWYTFDQVLIRPILIDRFVWDEFAVITEISGKTLLQNGKINKNTYSDHLPIKFEIRTGGES